MLRRAGTKNFMTWSSVIPLHSLTPFIPPKRSLNRVITLKFHGIVMNRCVLPKFFRLPGDNWIVNCFLFTFLMDKPLMTIYRHRWRHLRKCTKHMMYFHTKRERMIEFWYTPVCSIYSAVWICGSVCVGDMNVLTSHNCLQFQPCFSFWDKVSGNLELTDLLE